MNRWTRIFIWCASSLLTTFCIHSSGTAFAASVQIFTSFNYANPAALNQIKNGEISLGGFAINLNTKFSGTANGLTGIATSNSNYLQPYGQFASRINNRMVIGVAVTQPSYVRIQFPKSSVVRYSAIDTIATDRDYNFKISYIVTPGLFLGAGINANDLMDSQLNFTVGSNELTNKSNGNTWGFGWNAGLLYFVTPSTFFNLYYYSKIIHHSSGNSSSWGSITSNRYAANGYIPATSSLNVTQILSPALTLSATLRYSQWSIARALVLQNTAIGNMTIPLHYRNTWYEKIAARIQIHEKLALIAAIAHDGNPQATQFRIIGLPAYYAMDYSAGTEYAVTKSLSGKIIFGYGASNPPIGNATANGNMRVRASMVDFSLTWKI